MEGSDAMKRLKRLFERMRAGRGAARQAEKRPADTDANATIREIQRKFMDGARENLKPRTGA